MKKITPGALFVACSVLAKIGRLKRCGCIATVFLSACTTTHVQWDAKQMREQIIDYYNDEIMDNIIRMHVDKLPYVHVDISTVTAIATSQLSGSIGGGETRTNASTNSAIGVISGITHTVTRPFTYSVAPQRGESLSITAAPVIGSNDGETDPEKKGIYKAYYEFETFLKSGEGAGALVHREGLIPPGKEEYVPGTLKKYGTGYYYISNQEEYKTKYRRLCMALFTQARARPSIRELDTYRDTGERVQGLQALPQPPPP